MLRDPAADVSLQLTAPIGLVREGGPAVAEGNRVVVHGKPTFFLGRGTLSLRVDEIRAVGIGELLARIERLRQLLAAEGLFDPARKRRLPFLPGCIGLITGRASAAEHDVVSNATARWPAVRFRIENIAVQGALAVPQIVDALGALDRDPEVEVIVLARGGGSVEDLLPFSDETLCRAVAACRTPVVSAIGHEPDTPLRRPRRRPALLHPDRGRPAAGARPRRGDRADRRAARPGPARAAGWVDREQRLLRALRGRARCWPTRCAALDARAAEIDRLRRGRRGPPAARARPAGQPTSRTCGTGWPRSARPPPWPAATRWCSGWSTAPGAAAGAALGGRGRARATGCGSGSATARWRAAVADDRTRAPGHDRAGGAASRRA